MKLKSLIMRDIYRKNIKMWCPHCKLLTNRYSQTEMHGCGTKVISSELEEGIRMVEGWNSIDSFKDCPPVNKKVLIVHDDEIYNSVLQKGGRESYCWRIKNHRGIYYIDVFDAESWRDLPLILKRKNHETIWP